MKAASFLKQLVVLILVGICWLSCEKEDKTRLPQNQEEPNFITEDVAYKLLENYTPQQAPHKAAADSKLLKKEINELIPIGDEKGKTVFYIANYDGGGFVILAADNRIEPILAYSDNSEFRTNTNDFPSGLVEWLVHTKEAVQSVRTQNVKQSLAIKQVWDNMTLQSTELDTLDRGDGWQPCQNEYWEVGPLLTTTWRQDLGFNSMLPLINCSGNNRNVYAGCVPIAIAQVMKYHSYPPNYSWANMPDSYPSSETARLIRDIHSIVPVQYDCGGTGVSTDYNIAEAFINGFGYSTATTAAYSYETVISELIEQSPVILSGGRKSGWWIFSSYTDGHMWVCDGYSKSISWYDSCNTGYVSIFLSMNWGWGESPSSSYNGWYSASNFNPGNNTFNYEVKMVYNLKP